MERRPSSQYPRARAPPGPDGDPRPVVFPRAVRPGPGRNPLPGPRRDGSNQRVSTLASGSGEGVVALDGQHIGHVVFFQPPLQVLRLAIDLIGGEPGERHPASIARCSIA